VRAAVAVRLRAARQRQRRQDHSRVVFKSVIGCAYDLVIVFVCVCVCVVNSPLSGTGM
jgi:uncharacterized membrane protein YidH (DUF202 family)